MGFVLKLGQVRGGDNRLFPVVMEVQSVQGLRSLAVIFLLDVWIHRADALWVAALAVAWLTVGL